MQQMTHSEIRGTLILLAIMLIIIAVTAITRSCSDDSAAPAELPQRALSADSILLHHHARQLASKDSLGREHQRSANRKSPNRSRRANRKKHITPLPSPTPSPLDRPANSE